MAEWPTGGGWGMEFKLNGGTGPADEAPRVLALGDGSGGSQGAYKQKDGSI